MQSAEVESIARQLFATSLDSDSDGGTVELVKRELLLSMSKSLDIEEGRIGDFASRFFNTLARGVEDALRNLMEPSTAAHEAMSAARQRQLLGEISNLSKNLSLLESKSSMDVPAILAFEAKYRDAVASVHKYIRPPSLDGGRKVSVADLFVEPRIIPGAAYATPPVNTVELRGFLAGLHRGVLLGDPGAGKTILATHICHVLSSTFPSRPLAGRELTPALVVLREYGARKKVTGCSILDFISEQAASRYQLQPPGRAFEYLLLNGRMSVIFDGLDELLETNDRREITSNVETFCTLYATVPVLVTSRKVGYEQAPLDTELFEAFQLAPFDGAQVREYARRWFELDDDKPKEEREARAQSFIAESSSVEDIRSNPLLLGLMCNLYKSAGFIPRNRPSVYEKCSEMLFERWDRSRGIRNPLPFETHIRAAVSDVAFWIFSTPELQSAVAERELTQKTAEYLALEVFDDIPKAQSAAADFVRFCTERAWVLTDVGTTKEGERLYQFTHRTFLEYFTASHLVTVYGTPSELFSVLAPRIAKGEWDLVSQLAFHIQSRNLKGAADELLAALLTRNDEENWRLRLFAERGLEFLVPRPAIRRDITRSAAHACLNQSGSPSKEFGNLLGAATENRDTIAAEIRHALREAINSSDAFKIELASELILDLPICRRDLRADAQELWSALSYELVEECGDRIRDIARTNWPAAFRCYWRGWVSTAEGIRRFGIKFLLVAPHNALGIWWAYSPGRALVEVAVGKEFPAPGWSEKENAVQLLEELANSLIQAPTPWIEGQYQSFVSRWPAHLKEHVQRPGPEDVTLSPDADFTIMCILAAGLEWLPLARALEDLQQITLAPERIRTVLAGRFSATARERAFEFLARLRFSEEQRKFVSRWIAGDLSLTEEDPFQVSQRQRRLDRAARMRNRLAQQSADPAAG